MRLGIAVALFLVGGIEAAVAADLFKAQQAAYPRVRAAIAQKGESIKALFVRQNLDYPPKRILIRVFKQERRLELWIAKKDGATFGLFKEYPLCAVTGGLGPKRKIGDGQIPEGFYFINRFNPVSSFHLSLGINYPNGADRINGEKGRLGGDIFIHGGCVTIGCLPITDDGIKELYLIAVEARSAGQTQIPVHIFPLRLDQDGLHRLERDNRNSPSLLAFWLNLKEGFDYFERERRVPDISIDYKGRYVVRRLP